METRVQSRHETSYSAIHAVSVAWAAQQKGGRPNFPNNEEIALVVRQAERAVQQYKQAVDLEAMLPSSKENHADLDTEKQNLQMAAKLLNKLHSDPSMFHGLLGFSLQSVLDDLSRNAALCTGSEMSDLSMQMMAGKFDKTKAFQLTAVGKACKDAGTSLYAVSENVHELYVREIVGQQILIDQLTSILKTPRKEN